MSSIKVTALGQVGYLFETTTAKWAIDPYLFDYVAELYGEAFKNQVDLDLDKVDWKGIDVLFVTHEHEDHCDPQSIEFLLKKNPDLQIVCPRECAEIVASVCKHSEQVLHPEIDRQYQVKGVNFYAIPSAHTELELSGKMSRWLGYLFSAEGINLYHAGDTIPFDSLSSYLHGLNLHYAFLPVNERNYFKDRQGIIGNMTSREAFALAEELQVQHWFPTHYDVFENNGLDPKELDLVGEQLGVSNYSWIPAGTTEFL